MRSLPLALQNLWRNKLMTGATLLIMALILFTFNVIFTVNFLARETIRELKTKVDMILYLQDNADPLLVNKLTQELEAFPETVEVRYTSKDQALEGLLDKYTGTLEAFTSGTLDNPLPASLQIITQKPEDHDVILTYLEQADTNALVLDVESNRENQQIATNFIKVTRFTEKLLLGIVITFILGSLLIVANAVTMTLFHRKKEIQIMHMVGAELNFIRAPFLIEGAVYGALSALIAMSLLVVFVRNVDFSQVSFLKQDLPYLSLLGIQILLSAGTGMLSSHLTLNHYLKRASQQF